MGSKKREFYIKLAQMPAPMLDILLALIEREEDKITAEQLMVEGWNHEDKRTDQAT